MKTCLWYAKEHTSSIFVMITNYSFSFFFLRMGLLTSSEQTMAILIITQVAGV